MKDWKDRKFEKMFNSCDCEAMGKGIDSKGNWLYKIDDNVLVCI